MRERGIFIPTEPMVARWVPRSPSPVGRQPGELVGVSPREFKWSPPLYWRLPESLPLGVQLFPWASASFAFSSWIGLNTSGSTPRSTARYRLT